jgi:hypothetical protein
VDGYLYVISRDEPAATPTEGPNGEKGVAKPKLVFRDQIGGGTSTPIIVDDYLLTAGYDKKVRLYRIDCLSEAPQGARGEWLTSPDGKRWFVYIHELASFEAGSPFESTPIVWKGRVYVGNRDGCLYCLGGKRTSSTEVAAAAR